MKITDRMDKLEAVIVTHLEESGAIRTDLAWLKKAFWTLAAAMIAAVVAQIFKPGEYHDQQIVPQVQQVSRNH